MSEIRWARPNPVRVLPQLYQPSRSISAHSASSSASASHASPLLAATVPPPAAAPSDGRAAFASRSRLGSPPVILFHKFFSESETAAFIRHGKGRYEKSLGVGIKEDGTMGDVKTEIRTYA